MVSREFIYLKIKCNHCICLYLNSNSNLDGLSNDVYLVYDVIVDNQTRVEIENNISNGVNSEGMLTIEAKHSSELDNNINDLELRTFRINTKDIESYSIV